MKNADGQPSSPSNFKKISSQKSSPNLNIEDIILYTFTVVLLVLFSIVLKQSQTEAIEIVRDTRNTELWTPSTGDDIRLNYINAKVALTDMRYTQARLATVSAITRKNLGFLVGTTLVFLGSIIVIRGIRDSPIQANLEAMEKARINITTSSPGIFIALLGSIIITATIIVNDAVSVDDGGFSLQFTSGVTQTPEVSTLPNDASPNWTSIAATLESVKATAPQQTISTPTP